MRVCSLLALSLPTVHAGVMLGEPSTVPEPAILKRLWVHEVMRVYYDRLVEDSDRAWIVRFLKETMTKVFNTNFDELFKKLDFNNDGIELVLLVCDVCFVCVSSGY